MSVKLDQLGTKNRPLFTVAPDEHYQRVQDELRKIEESLVVHLQRLIKRLYPELLAMIPKDIAKSSSDLEEYIEDFEEDDERLLIESTRKREGLLGQAMMLGIVLGGAYMWDQMRHNNSVSQLEFEQAYRPSVIFSTNFDTLLERSRMTSESVAMTINKDARNYLKRALDQGLTYNDIAQGLKEVLGYDNAWRAVRVARTEANWAANQGIANAASSLGIRKYTVNLSPRACEICIRSFLGVKLSQSQIDSELPKHPNCTCTASPDIPNNWDINDYI
jgi:hypothetical protein